jgi:ABC-type multidrug transport system fused ATPase/permease subunit
MTLSASLVSLFAHLSSFRRWQLMGLFFLMLVSALAEMATLGAVVPFLALLADPTVANNYPILQNFLFWFGAEDSNVLLSAGILFCMITISAAMIRIFMMWSSMRFSFGLGADIGAEVYRRTLHQPYSWHVSQNSSNIIAAIDKVNHVIGGILTPIMQGSVALVMASGILIMLIIIDWSTALIAGIGFTVLYLVTTFLLRSKVARNSELISVNMVGKVQAIQEGLGGIRDVLLDGTQRIYHSRFMSHDSAVRRAQASGEVIGASPRYIIEAVGMILIVGLAYWLSPRQGGLTGAIPVLGALAIGAQKLLPQMQLVYSSWSSINGSHNQLEDVLGFLEKPASYENYQSVFFEVNYTIINQSKLPKDFSQSCQSPLLALRNVSFRYNDNMPEVLNNINLEIPKGSRVGFIGKTGSGKSTLIDLIMALLQPTSGQIEVDGIPINEHNYRNWQLRIAHVPQTIYLSDATIAENIAFGVPLEQIDLPRVKIASTKAQLSDFIERQPHKYQTHVGERGVRLSGGQRQRIGLARALYKQADILVLDEATSALDDLTEQSVMSAIKALGNELTVLMIAHRVSTLRDCDKIVELDNASVLRVGRYENIIESRQN